MRRLFFASAVAGLSFACAGVQLPREQLTAPGALVFNGYANPQVTCYRCHGGDATGTMRGPNLAKKVPQIPDEQIAKVIQEGKSFMPSFKGKITDEEQAQVVNWLRSSFPAAAK